MKFHNIKEKYFLKKNLWIELNSSKMEKIKKIQLSLLCSFFSILIIGIILILLNFCNIFSVKNEYYSINNFKMIKKF